MANLKQNEPRSARAESTHEGVKDVPLVEITYLVFTRMPGESYRGRLRSLLLYLCYVFRALINSLGALIPQMLIVQPVLVYRCCILPVPNKPYGFCGR